MLRCPGQDQRFWKPDDIFEINCPSCGTPIEFWKDEPKLKCSKCKQVVANPKIDLGCAQWCKYAKECLGVSTGQDSNILCNKLVAEMRKAFASDKKRIKHTLNVLKYAEQIQLVEGGDPLVVKAAAILHDVEGIGVVREILAKYGIEAELIERICRMIASSQSSEDVDSVEFKIVWDANRLVNIGEQFPSTDSDKIKKLIDSTLETQKGRQLGTELFINLPNQEAN